MAKGGSPMGGGGFGGQQGGFSGGFQPSRQGFNQMPQQQNFGGFDGGYGMPQQQQNFGGFGGGYNMSQQYTDDGSGYGGGYGMPQQLQQFQQQARQYQQPMQQMRQYQQPMQQRFQQQARQYQQPMQQSMLQQSLSNMPQQGGGSSQAAAQNAYLQSRGMPQSDGGMDAGMGEYNRVSAERNMAERAALANQPLGSMEDRVSRLTARGLGDSRSQAEQPMVAHTGMPQDYGMPQMPPAPNMNQAFPEDQRMQFMRMMQQMNFSGGRPYGRSEYTQRY